MKLGDLIDTRDAAPDALAREIAAITSDSRRVTPGSLFFAVSGSKADGLSFADEAARRGAAAIIAERAPAVSLSLPLIVVPDVRAALARAAARINPRQPAIIAAVTGTSGKTSVAEFLRQIWNACGRQAASLGTIGIVAPSGAVYGSLTTPDPLTLHETLDRLAGDGVTHLAMEASSHGLDQRRLDGVRLATAAFTNLSRDHLDYHSSLEDYLAAKLRLFDTLLPVGAPAVVNADSDAAAQVVAHAASRGRVPFTVGAAGQSIRLLSETADGLATILRIAHNEIEYKIRLPLAGAFQASNALVAAGLAISTGESPAAVFAALESLKGAPGRLELIGETQGAGVFVDYAHKPDALAKTLAALRPLAKSRLVVVFGCGGDRDRGKRPIMGEIAARGSDIVVVTDDNPRSEIPASIRAEILAGTCKGPAKTHEIADRREAIVTAMGLLADGDILVVAGKGHETGQIVGSKVLEFSDHAVIRSALSGGHQ